MSGFPVVYQRLIRPNKAMFKQRLTYKTAQVTGY